MIDDGLFPETAKYAIDTNVIVSFLGDDEGEHYPADVFAPQWAFIERYMQDGRIVAAQRVEVELQKWKRIAHLQSWLHQHRYLFHDIASSEELACARRIVNRYPAYASDINYHGDLEVMSFAMARKLTVISLESTKQHKASRPKMPNVCDEFGIGYRSLKGFLRDEGFGSDARRA